MISVLKKYQYLVVGIIFGLIVVYALAQQVVNSRLSEFRVDLDKDLEVAESDVVDLAKLISQGGVNSMAANVMQDCSANERIEFDDKLGKLDKGLSQNELADLDRLFSRCAPVSAIHKAVMTMQLRQEIQILENLVAQRKLLGEYTEKDEALMSWNDLLNKEERLSDLSFSLVSLQKEIIDVLSTGVKANSAEAEALRIKGQDLRNEITSTVAELVEIRKNLFDA